jgi:hypothetical protein
VVRDRVRFPTWWPLHMRDLTRKATALVIAGLALVGCSRTQPDKSDAHAADSATASSTSVASAPVANSYDMYHAVVSKGVADTTKIDTLSEIGLECSPKVFSRSDTITLHMDARHGEYLIVHSPDKTPFWLSYPKPAEPPGFFLLSSGEFAQTPTLRFKADVRARPMVNGRDTLETVFSTPGTYTLEIGRNMEGDGASDIYKCTMRLKR